MITLNNINLSSIDLSGIDLRGIKLGLEGRGGGSGDGFPQLPGDVTRWHFGGLTNEMMAAMDDPRIEDADHKGRFLSFKNFAWKEGSGISDVYPGFILGDRVDDFAVTEKELNFEDTYTVYTAFIPFQDDPARNMILCGKNDTKDFSIDYSGTHLNFKPSTGVNLAVRIDQFALLVCKRNKDITTIINLSTGESRSLKSVEFISNPGLYYLWRNVFATFHAKAAIAGQIIDNGHFTTDEEDENILNWHKKQYPWLFPDQAWTVTGKTNEDEDRATIANITGNGNDLILSNFGFAEGSGYGLYGQNYISYAITNRAVYTKTNSSIHVTKSITAGVNFTESARDVTIPSYRIKVTGIQSGQEMIYRGRNNTFLTNIPSDGIYVLPAVENGSNLGFQFVSYTGDCDITIEQIPEYEGYLVTDGVEDMIRSSSFLFGNDFTVVGEWEFLQEDSNVFAGFYKNYTYFVLYNYISGVNGYVKNGKGTLIRNTKTLKAVTSEGLIYTDFNSEQKVEIADKVEANLPLYIAYNGNNYTKMAFKNLAIYPTVLSKDDCIKAYNYLQTLKAK